MREATARRSVLDASPHVNRSGHCGHRRELPADLPANGPKCGGNHPSKRGMEPSAGALGPSSGRERPTARGRPGADLGQSHPGARILH